MVNVIVDNTINRDYRETNLELARENSELRQQLGHLINENNELKTQLAESISIRYKYNKIVNVVLDRHSLDLTHTIDENHANTCSPPGLDVISEREETYDDSLDLPEVTSVPPLRLHPEQPPQTPSIFRCLDSICNEDMLQSTPVQTTKNDMEEKPRGKKRQQPAKRTQAAAHSYNLRKRTKT